MRAVLFDFNGTLFQDTSIHFDAWKRFLARRNIPLSEYDFQHYMCGPPNEAILRRFIDPDLSMEEVDRLSEEKEGIYRAIVRDNPACQKLTDGAIELFEQLKIRGIPYAIATGSSKDNVDFYFETLNIGRWFPRDRVLYAEHAIPGKPDPTIYRLALKKLGIEPEDAIVVEDALLGVQAAIGSGIKRIVALDTTFEASAFADIPQVIAVIHDFYGFEPFVDETINIKEDTP